MSDVLFVLGTESTIGPASPWLRWRRKLANLPEVEKEQEGVHIFLGRSAMVTLPLLQTTARSMA